MRKIAFITGADRGLGRNMAEHLVRADVGIVGTHLPSENTADAVVHELWEAGGTAAMLPLDVGDAASFGAFRKLLVDTLNTTFGRSDLDFVVQNAGHGVLGRFEEIDGDGLDSLYRVHFKGPFLLNQILVPMIRPGGRIINVSSATTRFYLEGHGAYSSIKAAVEGITRYMAKELGERGIGVNVIAPGAIETGFAGGEVRDNEELKRQFAEATPLGRVGVPDDIGKAVAALLSDGMGWVNGQRIEITGGQSL